MKNLKYLLILVIIIVISGCGSQQYSVNNGELDFSNEDTYEQEADRVADNVMRLPEIENTDDESEEEISTYLGRWARTAIYVNGGLQGETLSILNFSEDGTYNSSTDVCTTSGTHEKIGDNSMKMVMMQNGCPGGKIPLPFIVTNTYSIKKNEGGVDIMTIVTGPVTETYIRQ